MSSERSQQNTLEFPYVYAWGNNQRRAELKGRPCKIITDGKMRSVEIEFEDGFRVITSRRALRGR